MPYLLVGRQWFSEGCSLCGHKTTTQHSPGAALRSNDCNVAPFLDGEDAVVLQEHKRLQGSVEIDLGGWMEGQK